jgi:hypothetical protein
MNLGAYQILQGCRAAGLQDMTHHMVTPAAQLPHTASSRAAGYADKTKVKVNRLLGLLRGALLRAGDLASCEQVRRARVPILKVGRL